MPRFLYEDFPSVDLGLYDYISGPRRVRFTKSISFDEQAQHLAGTIRELDRYSRVMMLGHSLGGLLCQYAIVDLLTSLAPTYGGSDEEAVKKIAGLFLLGTPQAGTHLVLPGLGWITKDFRVLRQGSTTVGHMVRTFANRVALHGDPPNRLAIPTFAVVGGYDWVVKGFSARLVLPDSHVLTVLKNHKQIVKPKHKSDQAYHWLQKRLSERIQSSRPLLDLDTRSLTSLVSDGNEPQSAPGADDGNEPEIPDEPFETVQVRLESLPKVHGRDKLLEWLVGYRRTGGLVVLVGAGGMGKSTLARELVRRTAVPEPPPEWEVSAATLERLVDGLGAVAANLGGSVDERAAIGDGVRAGPDCLWRLLERAAAGWLLFVDNADELELLGKPGSPGGQPPDPLADGTGWVRTSRTGLVLVTSRHGDRHRWPGSAVLIQVGVLDVKSAAKLLRELAPNSGNKRGAQALARRLGCLPLALRLAGLYLGGRYTEQEHASFNAYRAALESDPRVIRLLKLYADDPNAVDADAVERMLVMRTWEMSLDALARHGLPQARPLLRLLSCFAPSVPIPLTLLQRGRLDPFILACSEPGRAPPRLDHLLQGIDHLGLIASTQGRGLIVHPVVADTNRAYLVEGPTVDPPEETIRATAVTLLAAETDALTIDRPSTWATLRRLTPHLQALIANSAPRLSGEALDALTGTTGQVAIGYGHMRRPAFGVELLTAVLAPREDQTRVGPAYLLARQRLALLLKDAGQHDAAVQIWREVLAVQLGRWPRNHPIVFAARHNLIVTLSPRHPWEGIRPIFDELLTDEVEALSEDHPITLNTRQTYALQVGSHDGWDAAEESLRSVVDDATRILGHDAPFTLGARHNLTQVLRRLDRHDDAEAEVRRLIQDERRALGDDHLLTAATARPDDGDFIVTWPLSVPQLHADFARYLLKKGSVMADGPDRESALPVFDDLLARFGDDPAPEIRMIVAEGMHEKALLLQKLDRESEAITTYDDLIARCDDDEAIGLRHLVAIAFHNKAVFSDADPDQAMEAAQQALRRYQRLADDKPEDFAEEAAKAKAFVDTIKANAPQSMLQHANALAQNGRRAEALGVLDRFIDRYRDDSSERIRVLVATAMLRKGTLLGTPTPPTD
jgi:tetratricopeptide (TPR) repeat protein